MKGNGKKVKTASNGEKKVKTASKSGKKAETASKSEKKEKTAYNGRKRIVFSGIVGIRGYSLNGILYTVGIPLELSNKVGISGGEMVRVSMELTGRNITTERLMRRARKIRGKVEAHEMQMRKKKMMVEVRR